MLLTFTLEVDFSSTGLEVGLEWWHGTEKTWVTIKWDKVSELSEHLVHGSPSVNVYFPGSPWPWLASCSSQNTAQGLACRDFSECPPCQAGFPRALSDMSKAEIMETFGPLHSVQNSCMPREAGAQLTHAHKRKHFSLVGKLLGMHWCNMFS